VPLLNTSKSAESRILPSSHPKKYKVMRWISGAHQVCDIQQD
jgi:hypothetical protein